MTPENYASRVQACARSDHWIEAAVCGLRKARYLEAPEYLIDYGCGTGELAPYAKEHGFSYFGIDPNLDLIRIARKAHPDQPFRNAATEALHPRYPVTLFLHFVLPHIKYGDDFLAEVYRRLQPGSVLVVTISNPWHRLCWKPLNLVNGYRDDPTILERRSRRGLIRSLQQAGFEVAHSALLGPRGPLIGRFFDFTKKNILVIGVKP